MQVTLNGKAAELTPKLEKELTSRKPPQAAEGVVLSAEDATALAGRNMRLLNSVAIGVAGVIIVAVLIGTASYEPGDLLVFVPLVVVLGAGLGVFVRFIYRRRMAKAAERTARNAARLPAPGVTVRVDGEGLAVGFDHTPWSALTVTEVEITEGSSGDSTVYWIDWMALSGGGRTIFLDCLMISNGRAVIDNAWRALRPQSR